MKKIIFIIQYTYYSSVCIYLNHKGFFDEDFFKEIDEFSL